MSIDQEFATYVRVLWRYKWVIAGCAIISTMVALGVSLLLTPMYTGTAIVRVASVSSGDYGPISSALLTRLTNTLVEIANSDSNLDEVARQFGMEKRPKVETIIIPETELIKISASDSDPARARDIANKVAGMMIQQSLQFYGDSSLTGRRQSLFTIIAPASLAQRPSTPKVPLNTALGMLGGIVTGVILAFLLEGMDNTVRDIEEVQAISALSIIGQIPEKKPTIASLFKQIFSRRDHFLPAPAFQYLGARLLLTENWPKSTSFLLTSPEPGAGKSTIAANLAISLANSGLRVTLVDMDFHRPCLHSIFGLPNEKGLSDFMCGKIPFEPALQKCHYANLRIATAGSCGYETVEYLEPSKIGELLERLKKDTDYVLIDAPAFLSIADPVVIASQADAVILVVAQRKSRRRQLRLVLQQLTEIKARPAGIVINRVPSSSMYTHYYYPERSSKKEKPAKEVKSIQAEEAQHLIKS